MNKIIESILEWSEVWALLIPLLVLMFTPKQPSFLKPVIVYLWFALLLNLLGDIIAGFKRTYHFPFWLQNNNPLYNIHSVIRFTCFSYFFISLKQPFFKILKKLLPLLSLLFISINFAFIDDFFDRNSLSGNLLSAEAYLLLIYCMLYYLSQLKDEDDIITMRPDFWVATGLSIYVVINFFVFLFYVPMLSQNLELAINIWTVHNVAYIILCLFVAKAFYATNRN
ncbi:MAG: hypothetical protein JWQ09_4845 [Segetibacter sp.]|nr:hypothetical protein [Segetibacter sp.]